MEIKISVSDGKLEAVTEFLTKHGITISDNAEYILTEANNHQTFLSVRNDKKEHVQLSVENVVFIEAFGKNIEIHTLDGTYLSQNRIYELETILDPHVFIRVSKSVIISKKHIKKIRPSLSMKFIITLSNNEIVDVTRSYYTDFKRFIGI